MPLDNAQFIAELSVTDPPGTDPLNQGDDHIRTTKLAVQQSFPNVGSAVPQTGVQMAQMAIKNEVNTFTQTQTFSGGNPAASFVGNVTFTAPNTTSTARIELRDAAGTTRWRLEKVQESIASDLRLQQFDAAGAFLQATFTIDAVTSEMEYVSRIKLRRKTSADFAQLGFADENQVNIWQLYMNTNDNNLQIDRRVGGVLQDTPVRILNATAQIIFNTGNITHQIAPGGTQLSHNWANTSAINRWGIIYSQSTGDLTIHPRSAVGSLESAILRLDGNGRLFMDRLPSGPTANSKEIYAKQSQLFAGTELVLGQTP